MTFRVSSLSAESALQVWIQKGVFPLPEGPHLKLQLWFWNNNPLHSSSPLRFSVNGRDYFIWLLVSKVGIFIPTLQMGTEVQLLAEPEGQTRSPDSESRVSPNTYHRFQGTISFWTTAGRCLGLGQREGLLHSVWPYARAPYKLVPMGDRRPLCGLCSE